MLAREGNGSSVGSRAVGGVSDSFSQGAFRCCSGQPLAEESAAWFGEGVRHGNACQLGPGAGADFAEASR